MRRKCVWNENETLCFFLVEELYRKWWAKILKINGFGLTKKKKCYNMEKDKWSWIIRGSFIIRKQVLMEKPYNTKEKKSYNKFFDIVVSMGIALRSYGLW